MSFLLPLPSLLIPLLSPFSYTFCPGPASIFTPWNLPFMIVLPCGPKREHCQSIRQKEHNTYYIQAKTVSTVKARTGLLPPRLWFETWIHRKFIRYRRDFAIYLAIDVLIFANRNSTHVMSTSALLWLTKFTVNKPIIRHLPIFYVVYESSFY